MHRKRGGCIAACCLPERTQMASCILSYVLLVFCLFVVVLYVRFLFLVALLLSSAEYPHFLGKAASNWMSGVGVYGAAKPGTYQLPCRLFCL